VLREIAFLLKTLREIPCLSQLLSLVPGLRCAQEVWRPSRKQTGKSNDIRPCKVRTTEFLAIDSTQYCEERLLEKGTMLRKFKAVVLG